MSLLFKKAIAMVFAALVAGSAAAIADGMGLDRPIYEIVVTAPGMRAQGWNGTLYRRDGTPLPQHEGTVETNIGTFAWVSCGAPHQPCGFVEQSMKSLPNEIMGSTAWEYRLMVGAECSRSETFHGDLLRDGKAVPGKAKDTIATPMGQFEWRARRYESGWYRTGWPHHMMSPESWPCTQRK